MSKVIVCAYHNVGFRCLNELLNQGAEVVLLFTHEDSPTEEIWFQSVRELARQNGIPCVTGDVNLPENVEKVRRLAPDFIFSFYYRTMIRPEVLDLARRGALNLHGSYLPHYRGRVPVNWAVINGETETGATLHYMVEKPDAGDIVDQLRVPIDFTDTALDVFTKVTEAAVAVISRSWPLLLAGCAPRIPMDRKRGSYFGGRKPADGEINWAASATRIYNLIRGVTHPYPGAFTYLENRKLLIWRAFPAEGNGEPGRVISVNPLRVGTGEGVLEIRSLQLDGEDEKTGEEFAAERKLEGKTFIRSDIDPSKCQSSPEKQ